MAYLLFGKAKGFEPKDTPKRVAENNPLTDGILKHYSRVSKKTFANRLVFIYANTADENTKDRIIALLSEWLSRGTLRDIPEALTDNLNNENRAYRKLFFSLAMLAPAKFAKKIMELFNYSTTDEQLTSELTEIIKYLAANNGTAISNKSFSENLLITIAYLINAKDILMNKKDRSEEDTAKLHAAYLKAQVISQLVPFVKLTKKDKEHLTFFINTLVEIAYFKPAVDTAINARLPEKDKIKLLISLHNHLSKIKKHIPDYLWNEIKYLDKKILDFLENKKIYFIR